jgi:type V secretory pathway adhesin AidA
MDAVGMTAVAVLNANLASGFGVAAFKAQVDAQKQMVAALQALTSSGPGQLVNMLV